MNTASTRTLHELEQIVKLVPVGTNLALLQLIWTMITGSFLPARGAVHTALSFSGFRRKEIQRSWTALRYGIWHIGELIDRFRTIVKQESGWVSNEYENKTSVEFSSPSSICEIPNECKNKALPS